MLSSCLILYLRRLNLLHLEIAMLKLQFTILLSTLLAACVINGQSIKPVINKDLFPGFSFDGNTSKTSAIFGYDFQAVSGDKLSVSNCHEALGIDENKIAEFDYHRFKLLRISCTAYLKYVESGPSNVSHLPDTVSEQWVASLPAEIIPLLSRADLAQKQEKSIEGYYSKAVSFTTEGSGTTKILSEEDENYLNILARGDFTNDGIEDILLSTEWYARNAHGKHADLLILTQLEGNSPPRVMWRLNNLDLN